MQKLLSMTAAALRASVEATLYPIRTAKEAVIIIFLLMAHIRGFALLEGVRIKIT